MAYKGVWHGCWEDHSWGSRMARHMNSMGVNHIIAAYESQGGIIHREKDIRNWIESHSESFRLAPYGYRVSRTVDGIVWKIMRDWVEAPTDFYSESDVQDGVNEILDFFPPFDPLSGYVIYEENYIIDWYKGSPYFNTVIETVHSRSGFGSKDLIVVGNMNEQYIPEWVRNKTWSYDEGLMMHESYQWSTSQSIEMAVLKMENDWRMVADMALAGSGKCRWVGIINCHQSAPYRYPDKKELLLSVLGPLAHGAIGTAVWHYDSNDGSGLYDSSSPRTNLRSAFTRLDQIDDLLSVYDFYGYSYNTEGSSYKDLTQVWPGSLLKRVEAGGWAWHEKVEVCKFNGGPLETYVICNRDPKYANKRDVTIHLTDKYIVRVDGSELHGGPKDSYTFQLPKGDVKVVQVT